MYNIYTVCWNWHLQCSSHRNCCVKQPRRPTQCKSYAVSNPSQSSSTAIKTFRLTDWLADWLTHSTYLVPPRFSWLGENWLAIPSIHRWEMWVGPSLLLSPATKWKGDIGLGVVRHSVRHSVRLSRNRFWSITQKLSYFQTKLDIFIDQDLNWCLLLFIDVWFYSFCRFHGNNM